MGVVAAEFHQFPGLLGGVDTFRDRGQAEGLAEPDDRRRDRGRVGPGAEADEADRQPAQGVELEVARADVVDREADPLIPERTQAAESGVGERAARPSR
nr:hypothetical protein [Actinoplanes lichenis]